MSLVIRQYVPMSISGTKIVVAFIHNLIVFIIQKAFSELSD